MNSKRRENPPPVTAPVGTTGDRVTSRIRNRLEKPLGIVPHLLVMATILAAPWWLFGLGRLPAWIASESSISTYAHQNLAYRLHSDDFAYIGSSRNWERTVDNLFVPHNTHICPSWRVLTYAVVQAAGDLVQLPGVLKLVSYLGLMVVMLATGHFVAYESKSLPVAFAATILVGVTSIQRLSTIWYSAGQTLWAGAFILGALILTQQALHRRSLWLWPGVFLACWAAGGFWTIGHAAGPVTAIYVIAASRGRNRLFALVPAAAMITAVAIALSFGGKEIDASTSFHGRSTREAFNPVQGLSHTCHSIIETMILANLGIDARTTDIQAVTLTLILFAIWCAWHRGKKKPVTTLEWVGAALCISAYWVEWSFRGYFSWNSLKGVVYWYDSIPQIGWTLFVSGWAMAAFLPDEKQADPRSWPKRVQRKQALALLGFVLTMLVLHQSEVDRQLIESIPPLTAWEIENNSFPIPELRRLRAVYIWDERAKRMARHIARFQNAESIARKAGWSIADISTAFGRVRIPGIPKAYDGVYLMDLPLNSDRPADTATVRRALASLLEVEPEARPPWLSSALDAWPPKGWEDTQ